MKNKIQTFLKTIVTRLRREDDATDRAYKRLAFSTNDLIVDTLMRIVITMFVVMAVALFNTGFFGGGMAYTIGGAYASVCTVSGVCDLGALNAAFATANVILLYLLIIWGYAIFGREDNDTEMDALAELDESIIALRDHITRNGAVLDEIEGLHTKLNELKEALYAVRQ